MAELAKKSKQERIDALNKIDEYLKTYNTVVVAENTNIQNRCLQKLRSLIDGKVVFAKKGIIKKKFPQLNYTQNFFLIFTNESELEKASAFEYLSFMNAGDRSPQDFVIPRGVIANEKLANMLAPIERTGAINTLTKEYCVICKGAVADEKAVEILRMRDQRPMTRKLTIIDTLDAKKFAV